MRTITDARPLPDYRVRLTYSDGSIVFYNVGPLINQGGVFAVLRDIEVFNRVEVGERGRYLSWPNEIDLCADALWLEANHLPNENAALETSA